MDYSTPNSYKSSGCLSVLEAEKWQNVFVVYAKRK
jgi:hypothetical protein